MASQSPPTLKNEDTKAWENNASKTVLIAVKYLLLDIYTTCTRMAHNITSLNELPFHDLNLDELLKEMGSWVNSSLNRLLDKKDLFKDTIKSPNGENDHYEHYIDKYYSVKQTGMHFDEAVMFLSTSLMNSRMNRYTLLKIQQCAAIHCPPESSSEQKNAITKCHVITKRDDKSKVLM